jgi:DNA-binding transcriptional LysR family regulator
MMYIMEIYQQGSMNKAAQAMFISQSTISSAIKAVESELGISVFYRGNKGIIPTEEGNELIAQIKPIVEQSQKVARHYEDKNSAGTVRLSVSTQRYPFCTKAFVEFMKLHPEQRQNLQFKECELDKVIRDVSGRQSELGIVFVSPTTEKYMKKLFSSYGVVFSELKPIRPRVFLRKGHPLSGQKEIELAQLRDYPIMAYEKSDTSAFSFSEEVALRDKYSFDKIIIISDRASFYSIVANSDAVTTGTGIIPEGYADDRVMTIPIKEEQEVMKIGYIKLQDVPLSDNANEYIEMLGGILDEYD